MDSSQTSINVALPIFPKGGYLSVEPCNSGAHAFHTNFHIDARDWMLIGKEDSNMQLEYYFGYTVDGTTVYLSVTYSTANEVGTTRVCIQSWFPMKMYCVLNMRCNSIWHCLLMGRRIVHKFTKLHAISRHQD